MSRAEKRYYKLFIGRHAPERGSNHEVLFDAIAAMSSYDEGAILDKFRDDPFTHRFAITKRRLYETILRSLDAFHAESSVDTRLYRQLHHVELLYQRALYEDALKMLQSVLRLAEQYDRTHVLMISAEWERRLIECRNYADTTENDLELRRTVDAELVQRVQEVNTLWDLKSQLFLRIYKQGQARDKRAVDAITELLDHPILKDPSLLKTARAQFLFHHLQGVAAFAVGNTSACYEHLKTNLALLTTHRNRFRDETNLVLGVMSNLIYVCVRLGRYAEAFAHLRTFRTLPSQWDMPESDDLDLKLFSTSASLELSIHLRMGEFKEALETETTVLRELGRHADRIGPLRMAGFHYQLAYAHFGMGQFDRSLRWLNELLNRAKADDQSDVVYAARLLQLLTFLELGKSDLLGYALRNTERFLRTHDRKHRFEPLFLKLVHGLNTAPNESVRQELLRNFLAAISSIAAEPMEHPVFDHFDPVAWAESKLTGGSFAERIKQRMRAVERAA